MLNLFLAQKFIGKLFVLNAHTAYEDIDVYGVIVRIYKKTTDCDYWMFNTYCFNGFHQYRVWDIDLFNQLIKEKKIRIVE